jgi:phage gp37-like protein
VATTISQLEDQLLLRLNDLTVSVGGGYVRTLRAYGGDFQQARAELVLILPCILIQYGGAIYKRQGGGGYEVLARWHIVVADNSHRGEQARRRGTSTDSQNPGTYQMLEDLKARLDGEILLAGTRPLELADEELVRTEPNLSLYRQIWHVGYFQVIG